MSCTAQAGSDPSLKYNNELGLCDINSKKAFRGAAFGVLEKASIKIPASKVYLKWNDSHSLTAKSLDTFGGYRSFDEVSIDETVVNVARR